MVDSSIGGKTGVDTRDGKNLIGAFHQPSLVIDDLDLLKTLPRRQFNQGFAEIIKHAIIADPKMFRTLQSWKVRAARPRYKLSSSAIFRSNRELSRKTNVTGLAERALLNFGQQLVTRSNVPEITGNFYMEKQ